MAMTVEQSGSANTSGTHAASLLLVDDDPDIREEMRTYLSANGMIITEAADAASALEMFSGGKFDLVILDLLLGADNGFDVLREIRQTHSTPCIMVTGQSEATDKVVGLELGADDYVVKPVNLRELLARIRALLRRTANSGGSGARTNAGAADSDEAAAQWKFDPHRRRLCAPDGALVPLTTAECDLLIELVAHEGNPQTREELCRRVFNRQWQPYDRSLDSIVVKLRRKLEPNPDHPMVIKTIRGKGYLFTGFPSGD
ncbi:two component transcriptional regulator, winged helix family [Parvibaculum lavamentivorans DS-1]|uniref:Two component transcriptional regulator, winged helix family n=1 Tax=Parvibaculum lavamentivorans (strain DS-1 / DSM 13023 / NCIMB 13966) TaxID=402881 RepID=A7HP70_PARL1|nr:response regulator transcription factor [Parvibaculum lavamentivorans]ABS61703.1 two component transcriptional regulator, winged helix family [Parvibaculum lavamentivorans DS-1]